MRAEGLKLKNLKNWCKRHIKHQIGKDNDSGCFDTMDYLEAWSVIDKINELLREGDTDNASTNTLPLHSVVFSEAELKAKLDQQKEEMRQWLEGEGYELLAERL